jgi:hypothetical protein
VDGSSSKVLRKKIFGSARLMIPCSDQKERHCAYDVTLKCVHETKFRLRKAITYYIFLCVCVCVGLLIQHAKRIRRIILPSVACLARQYFSTLSHKWQDFQEINLTQNVF